MGSQVIRFVYRSASNSPSKVSVFSTASWAAMNYPDIRALMLDATFDNIFHLAAAVMPASWNVLVDVTVRHHLNLNVAKQLEKYRGPVLLFRRTRDEVISLK